MWVCRGTVQGHAHLDLSDSIIDDTAGTSDGRNDTVSDRENKGKKTLRASETENPGKEVQ